MATKAAAKPITKTHAKPAPAAAATKPAPSTPAHVAIAPKAPLAIGKGLAGYELFRRFCIARHYDPKAVERWLGEQAITLPTLTGLKGQPAAIVTPDIAARILAEYPAWSSARRGWRQAPAGASDERTAALESAITAVAGDVAAIRAMVEGLVRELGAKPSSEQPPTRPDGGL